LIVLTAYVRIEGEQLLPAKEEGGENLPWRPPLTSAPPPVPVADAPLVQPPAEPQPFAEIGPAVAEQDVAAEEGEKIKAAVEKMREKDYAGAVRLFKDVADKNRSVLAAAGLCYFKIGDYGQAIPYFTRALELDGKDFSSLKLLALSYYRTDDIEKSLRSTEAALSLKHDNDLESLLARLKKETRVQDGYNEESSAHFTIYYDGYSHGKINREIIGMLEDAYRTVGRELDFYPVETVTVILYGNKDFFDITQTPSRTAGFYDGKIRVPVGGIDRQSGPLKKVLYHEYTHAVVHAITKRCPLWINEGLAEYFSDGHPEKIGQVIPLRSIEKSFSGLGAGSIPTAYRESYSAVSYLIEKYGIYRVKELLVALSRGDDVNTAFGDAFGVTYDEFIRKWN
jgi:tetratricopeptide (TPR) repeat protein